MSLHQTSESLNPKPLVRFIGMNHWHSAIRDHCENKIANEKVISTSKSGWIYILEYQGIASLAAYDKHIYHGMIFHLPNIDYMNMSSVDVINYINNKQIEVLYHLYWEVTNGKINLMH